MIEVHVDAAADGTFSESWTARALRLSWRLGGPPERSMAAPGRAECVLDNADGLFSPLRAGRPLVGLWLRLSEAGQPRFTGVIAQVEVQPGAYGARTARVLAVTAEAGLGQQMALLEPRADEPADSMLRRLLAGSALPRLALRTLTVADAAWSTLGSARLADEVPLVTRLQPARSVITGALFVRDLSAAAAASEVVAAERGRLYADRDGALVLLNRHALLLSPALAFMLTDGFADARWAASPPVNRVSVRCLPRSAGAPESALWTLAQPQRIPPGMSALNAHFTDVAGQPVAALSLSRIDFSANLRADGSGPAAALTIRLQPLGATAARLEIDNPSAGEVFLLAGAVVRGQPVSLGAPLEVMFENPAALPVHGPVPLALDLPLLEDAAQAESIARFELARSTAACLTQVSLDRRDLAALPALFSRVRLVESQTGEAADYWLCGEAHTVEAGGARHRITWDVMLAAPGPFWELGAAALGSGTVPAF